MMPPTKAKLGDTAYRRDGDGAPVVLIHGLGMDLTMWDRVLPRLASGREVIRYDMIGHGASAKPAGPYRAADFVAQLVQLADGLGLARFDLVGFSMGGLVAQAFALAHPSRLRRLVLLNTVYNRSAEERAGVRARVEAMAEGGIAPALDAMIERWFTPSFVAANPALTAASRRDLLANDAAAYLASYRFFAEGDRDLVGRLHAITAPTLVVTGAADPGSTPAMAEALARELPQGSAMILAGLRHATPIEAPARVATILGAFIAEDSGTPRRALRP